MSKNDINWLSDWYLKNCDGEWEHQFGIKIETIDNPGWAITIDTENTAVQLRSKPWVFNEEGESDWYGYKFENGKFEASGDPSKLEFLISLFRRMVEDKI